MNMLKNSYMFQEQTAYSFEEVMNYLINETGQFAWGSPQGFIEILQNLGYLSSSSLSNTFALSFITIVSEPTSSYVIDANVVNLLGKIYKRYKDHYCFICKDEETLASHPESNKFMSKIINKVDYTFERYTTLLSGYASQKSHLLDKLGRTRAGTREMSNEIETSDERQNEGENSQTANALSLHNDTPQTTDVVATITGNQYVSDLRKDQDTTSGTSSDSSTGSSTSSTSGSDEFSETETWDTMTVMAKLDEIEKHYSNIWLKWLNEFDELFIEEVNF